MHLHHSPILAVVAVLFVVVLLASVIRD